MPTQPEGFFAETVDEQIYQLSFSGHTQRSTSEASVVQDLQALYEQIDSPEQVRRSLDTIWSRLADGVSPENQTLFSLPDQDAAPSAHASEPVTRPPLTLIPGQVASDGQADYARSSEKPMVLPSARPAQAKKRGPRRALVLSVMAAVVLLGVFSWVTVNLIALRNSSALSSHKTGPGTLVQATPIPATPAPQSLQDQARQLLSQFHQEVSSWGNAHQYFDKYNSQSYAIDYAYGQRGIGGRLDSEISQAKSTADFQALIDLIQTELTNLHAMEKDYGDAAPWNQAHNADSDLLNHYKLNSGLVIVVSLAGQSMRVYQNGQLLKAFLVTTGSVESPTLPGSWQIETRQSPTTLKSVYPKGSPFWFPDTIVSYVLYFHSGGYLICDGWWRTSFGPGTQFAHKDADGDLTANNGAEGAINLSESNMAALYQIARVNTPVIIY